jgi:hypothetical protein
VDKSWQALIHLNDSTICRTCNHHTADFTTVDQSSNPTSPGSRQKPSLEDLLCVRKGVWLYHSASVAAIIPHFEDLSDSMVSDFRTVNCSEFGGVVVAGAADSGDLEV